MNMTLKKKLIGTCIINCGQRSCPFLKEPSPEGNLVQILAFFTVELPSREGTGPAVAMRILQNPSWRDDSIFIQGTGMHR